MPSGERQPEFDHAAKLECPASGVLLGAAAKAFGLDDSRVGGDRAAKHLGSEPSLARAAREYFRGAWVAEEKQREIQRWVVEAVLHSGLLSGLELPKNGAGFAPPLDEFLTDVLHEWLRYWDAVFVQGCSGWPHPPRHLGGFVIGKLAVIDLAVRAAAILQLMGGIDPRAVLPYAGDPRPGRALFDALKARSGRDWTREGLAAELGVEKSTVDDWIDHDVVPREETIQTLATALSTQSWPRAEALRYLRVQWGIIGLRSRLEPALGRHFAHELFAAWACFIQWTLDLHAMSKQDRHIFLLGQVLTLKLGTKFHPVYYVLNSWLKDEQSKNWIDDIWVVQNHGPGARIQECFESIGDWPLTTKEWDAGPETGAMPVEDRRIHQMAASMVWMAPRASPPGDELPPSFQGHPERMAEWWSRVAKWWMSQGQHAKAIPFLVKALAVAPDDADHRCQHGICLWHVDPNTRYEEALAQLRRACELRPSWDYPVRWYLFDLGSSNIVERDAPALADLIRCAPVEPRRASGDRPTLAQARATVERHIKDTYLKQTQAPGEAPKPVLRCWLELC